MPVELASAYIQLIPSLKGAQGTITKELGGAGGAAGGLFTSSFAKALGPLAGLAAGAIGIGAITGFIKESVSSASNLQQSLGGVDAIFGKSAAQIHDWAKGAQTSVGLSENSYNELANVIGSQLKNAGTSMDKVGQKTNNLIKVGSDLAATFGGSTSDAVDAISSALKGERDPIERYGVSLNQAKVDAEAASLGFTKVSGALSTQASQAATLSLILKQTSAASGQFGAQTNTLAEQQQILGATFENVKAKVGTAFLPAITSVVGLLARGLNPALDAVTPFLNNLATGFTSFGTKLPGIMSGIGSVVSGLAPVFSTLGAAFGPVVATLGAAFTALAPIILSAVSNLSPLGILFKSLLPVLPQLASVVGTLATSIGGLLASALTVVIPFISTLVSTLSGVFVAVLPTIVQLVGAVAAAFAVLAPVVQSLFAAVLPLVTTLVSSLAPILVQLVTSVLPPIAQVLGLVVAALAPLIQTIASVLIPVIQALLPVITAVFGAIVPIIQSAMQIVVGIIKVVTGVLTGNWKQAFGGLKDIVAGAFSLVVNVIRGAVSIVGAAFKAVIDAGIAIFKGGVKFFADAGSSIINAFIGGIKDRISALGDAIGGVMDFVKGFFPHSPAKRGPFSGSGWRGVARSGGALAGQFTSGFNDGVTDFASTVNKVVPDAFTSSVAGTISNTSRGGGTSVLIANKTNVRLEDLVDVRIARNSDEETRAQRLGYQPLVFG